MNEDSANSPFAANEPNLSPQSVVDCASLTNCMGKNKESLKVKLMLRRPIDVLVDQGILPPPKSSPAFYEQKLKLERAKRGDFLKHKIQRRPQVNELIQQHILEETFDPSYYEQQRKLKKARLADDLNERLSHRPGPLELIKGNILHTDETLEQAIKEGQITFKKTCEGEVITNPPKRFVFEEESSSDSAPSPHQSIVNTCSVVNQQNVANYQLNNSFIVTNGSSLITIPQPEPPKALPTSTVLNTNLSYIVTAPVANILPSTTPSNVFISNEEEKTGCLNVTTALPSNSANATTFVGTKSDSNNAGPINQIAATSATTQHQIKTKKKVKSKNQPKTRIIKFHEYTGPPNAKKQSNSSQAHSETSYELLLKQQQLFLQWQLECHQKYPHMASQTKFEEMQCKEMPLSSSEVYTKNEIEKIVIKREDSLSPPSSVTSLNMNANTPQMNLPSVKSDESMPLDNQTAVNENSAPCLNSAASKQYTPIVKKIISKLEDMKVSDLKAELKKRNLPVSGAKQQLIERLKPFSDSVVSANNSIVTAELNGTAAIFNLGECKNASQLSNNQNVLKNGLNTNFTTIGAPLTNGTAFILKNNISNNEIKKGLNDEVLFITNNSEKFSTIPVQLKQSSPITLEAPTLTIPITNNFIPQYQIVSSSPADNKINLGSINLPTANTIQTQSGNNIIMNNKLNILNSQQSLLSNNLNYNQTANQIGKNSNLTIFTGEPIQLAPMKNGLSFNIAPAVPNIANKLVSIQNSGSVFHQFLLYPATINASQDFNSSQNVSKQRSNSLPSESMHQLQRNTSMPVVINNQTSTNKITTEMSDKCTPTSERKNERNLLSTNILKSSDQLLMRKLKKNEEKSKSNVANENLPNSSMENFAECNKLKTIYEKKSICSFLNSTLTNSNEKISSTNVEFDESTSNLSKANAAFGDIGMCQIQPDSTTSSALHETDFILNFDDLNEGLGELHASTIAKSNNNKIIFDEPMDFEVKSNCKPSYEEKNSGMIDFNDNWFEMGFDQSAFDLNTSDMLDDTSKLMESSSANSANSSFLDTINQIFDQGFSGTAKSDDFRVDNFPSSSPSFMTPSTSGNYPNQQCHFSANLSGNNLKYNFNSSNNAFSTDTFSEFIFEDSDFKNSDFPILLDS